LLTLAHAIKPSVDGEMAQVPKLLYDKANNKGSFLSKRSIGACGYIFSQSSGFEIIVLHRAAFRFRCLLGSSLDIGYSTYAYLELAMTRLIKRSEGFWF
jgi:hypothetical protein